MLKTEQKLGLAGEFRVIVRNKDGSIKSDTGMQSNLVVDNGIKHYLGLPMINSHGDERPHSNGFMNNCIVGTGNNEPAITDIALQNFVSVAGASRDWENGREEPTDTLHPGYVKLWKRAKYIFDNINNQNITELGLASHYNEKEWYGNQTIRTYKLMTRALIKDKSGTPIAVTVLEGEILEVIYQINMYLDIKRKTGSFTLTTTKDGVDTADIFDYFIQPCNIGSADNIAGWYDISGYDSWVSTWGVKEIDADLDANYDLDAIEFQNITHLNDDSIVSKIAGYKVSGSNDKNKYTHNYQIASDYISDFSTKTRSAKFTHGIYTHVHPNGIRAYRTGITSGSRNLMAALVVLKNRANGQGIKKTDRQLWEHGLQFTIDRWSE